MKKPTYMLLSEVKKTSNKFDATHKVAIYDVDKTSNEIPQWFKKFHEEEFKPFRDAFIKSQNEIPQWFKKFHEEEFKPLQETVIRMQNETPKWFSNFANQVFQRLDNIESRLEKHDKMFKMIFNRIDNLVSKNNLKE